MDTHHNLRLFFQPEFKRILECLNNHTHPLWGEGEPEMAEYQCPIFLALVGLCSQGLVFSKMIGHSPEMISSKYIKCKKWIGAGPPLGCMRKIFLIVGPGMDREGLTRW
jgi:hypothetical protein